jgi:hypothetical protein
MIYRIQNPFDISRLGGGVNQDRWLLEYTWQFVVCRHVRCKSAGLRLVELVNPTSRRPVLQVTSRNFYNLLEI